MISHKMDANFVKKSLLQSVGEVSDSPGPALLPSAQLRFESQIRKLLFS